NTIIETCGRENVHLNGEIPSPSADKVLVVPLVKSVEVRYLDPNGKECSISYNFDLPKAEELSQIIRFNTIIEKYRSENRLRFQYRETGALHRNDVDVYFKVSSDPIPSGVTVDYRHPYSSQLLSIDAPFDQFEQAMQQIENEIKDFVGTLKERYGAKNV